MDSLDKDVMSHIITFLGLSHMVHLRRTCHLYNRLIVGHPLFIEYNGQFQVLSLPSRGDGVLYYHHPTHIYSTPHLFQLTDEDIDKGIKDLKFGLIDYSCQMGSPHHPMLIPQMDGNTRLCISTGDDQLLKIWMSLNHDRHNFERMKKDIIYTLFRMGRGEELGTILLHLHRSVIWDAALLGDILSGRNYLLDRILKRGYTLEKCGAALFHCYCAAGDMDMVTRLFSDKKEHQFEYHLGGVIAAAHFGQKDVIEYLMKRGTYSENFHRC